METVKKLEFRTPAQTAREERDERIYSRWLEVQPQITGRSKFSVWRALGYEFDLTNQGIRFAIERYEKKMGKSN
jgi:hypothetical protein